MKSYKIIISHWLTWFAVGLITWFFSVWPIISKQFVFGHDAFYWHPLYHYCIESLYNGFVPLWNPYSHAGEIFFQLLSQLSLIDPITIFCAYFGRLLHINNLFYQYELYVFFRTFTIAFGILLFFNRVFPELRRYSYFLFFVVLLSSFTVSGYHQTGYIAFHYFPFTLYFFLRFLDRSDWFNVVFLGFFSGISAQGQPFGYIGTFLFLFAVTFLLFNRDKFRVLLNNKLKIVCTSLLFLIFSSPAWSLIFYTNDFYSYSRMLFSRTGETQILLGFNNLVEGLGSRGKIGDILSLGFFPLARQIYSGSVFQNVFKLSEMNMYISAIPFLTGLIGIILGKHSYKKVFIVLLILSVVLFIGPVKYNYLYQILFILFPLLRVVENTSLFASYFLFSYFFFFLLGLQLIIQKTGRAWIVPILFIFTLIELTIYDYQIYSDKTLACLKKITDPDKFSNFETDSTFHIKSRIKSVPPLYQGDPHSFNMNYSSLVLKSPVATDFEDNDDYELIQRLPPTSITYPILYYQILASEASQDLKEVLLGVNLPVFSFFPEYMYLPSDEILNGKSDEILLEALEHSIIIHEKGDVPKKKYEQRVAPEWSCEVTSYKPHDIELNVKVSGEGFLLFRDGYHPAWKCIVDGVKEKVFQANYNQKAVFLSRGDHTVEFVFKPGKYLLSLWFYFSGIAGVIIFFLVTVAFQASRLWRRVVSHSSESLIVFFIPVFIFGGFYLTYALFKPESMPNIVWTSTPEKIYNTIKSKESLATWKLETEFLNKGRENDLFLDLQTFDGEYGETFSFNGRSSFARPHINFRQWEGVVISLRVKPGEKENDGLSTILDNGHTATQNFVLQSADPRNLAREDWVFVCNGIPIPFKLKLNKWSHVLLIIDAEHGEMKVFLNGALAGENKTDPFNFGSIPLSIGKQSLANDRYFEGEIADLVVWSNADWRQKSAHNEKNLNLLLK
ncbi:MAG: LamG domain-containing protein [Candidatus Scalindua sp.]|nr:LamG domain-containing protein [Candidatus Scalindua sp.]